MLAFGQPWLLAGLFALGPLWWLIRRWPPPPRRVRLPTIVLLAAAPPRPAAARRPPPWLAALRLSAVALLLLALAAPEWRARPEAAAAEQERLALVIDNGWAAAAAWGALRERADRWLAALPPTARVQVIATASAPAGQPSAAAALSPEAARATLAALRPWPWEHDRAAAARGVARGAALVWFADGQEDAGADALRGLGGRVWTAPPASAAVLSATRGASGWTVRLARAAAETPLAVVARDGGGRELGRADVASGADAVRLTLASDARPARFELAPFAGPAGVFLVPASAAPPSVLLIDGARAEGSPPLLSGALYVRRALEPFAPVRLGSAAEARAGEMIVAVDAPLPPGAAADAVLARVRRGAVAVSFAGPRMAATPGALSPLGTGGGARTLGSVLGWEQPQPLGRWAGDGPFAGLPAFGEARVARQLLGGGAGADAVRWATLADGTPLVTARREGAGWLVLIHTAADPSWSSLPLSGALQAMLRRLLPLAADPAAADVGGAKPYRLAAMLDAEGALGPPLAPRVLTPAAFGRAVPSPAAPPGLWRSGALARPLNLGGALLPADFVFRPLRTEGLRPLSGERGPVALAPWLLALALGLIAVDGLLAAGLRGGARWGAAAAALGAATPAAAQMAHAPVAFGVVASGDAAADAAARAGMDALGAAVTQRTAVAPGRAAAVDPARPGLGLYPLLYWRPRAPLAPAAAQALRGWLERGGLLIVDPPPAMGAGALRAALGPLDPPPLERLGPRHVLARAFYRLEAAPLALGPAPIWIDQGSAGGNGRVARVIVASADWPARFRSADFATRETAIRFGVNATIYALTGDYKADRVHAAPRPEA